VAVAAVVSPKAARQYQAMNPVSSRLPEPSMIRSSPMHDAFKLVGLALS
jgi:hypothetical protein